MEVVSEPTQPVRNVHPGKFLSRVTEGVQEKPQYLLLHGVPGIGKSTFASKAPNPIFLCAEDGTHTLDVSRVTLDSYDDFLSTLEELLNESHGYQSVVIDTLDHLERFIFLKVKSENKNQNVFEIGYGKGYEYAFLHWAKIIETLEDLRRKKKMNIILLAHTSIKMHNDPQLMEGYDRYVIKLHQKSSEFIRDRVDNVLFANYQVALAAEKGKVNKAYGDGRRIVYTQERPSFVAKNRFDLPFTLALDWEEYSNACRRRSPKSTLELVSSCEELIQELKDINKRNKAQKYLETNKQNPINLSNLENRLKVLVAV